MADRAVDVEPLLAAGEQILVRTSLVGGGVQVEVIDTGVGIESIDRPQIFDPFFTTKKDGKGTGLGLSIVKNIIEAHRGSIHVESTPGEGTCFRILLPACV